MSNEEFVAQSAFVEQKTKYLQIRSVCAFMEVFNYYLGVDGKFYNNTTYKEKPIFQGCETVSFQTAVTLHNRNWRIREIIGVDEGVFKIDPYTMNKAQAAKIVQQVFLQGTKHGGVKCHKHLVKFTDPAYQYMFLEVQSE